LTQSDNGGNLHTSEQNNSGAEEMSASSQLYQIAKEAQERADNYTMSIIRIDIIVASAMSDSDKLAAIKGELEAATKRAHKA
jgi:hypothetical protein